MLDNLHTDSSFFRVHHMGYRAYHPRYWITIAFLVYGIYLIYGILNPKKKYYFASYWLPRGDRGRIFIACDEFKVREMEEIIAKDKGVENAVIDYYRQISKEEYKIQKDK